MFRPGGTVAAREAVELLMELPDDSAFVASMRASAPADAPDTAEVSAYRMRRRWRGWDVAQQTRASTAAALGVKLLHPSDDGPGKSGGRKVVAVIPI